MNLATAKRQYGETGTRNGRLVVLCRFGSTSAVLQGQYAAEFGSLEKRNLMLMLSAGGYYQSIRRV